MEKLIEKSRDTHEFLKRVNVYLIKARLDLEDLKTPYKRVNSNKSEINIKISRLIYHTNLIESNEYTRKLGTWLRDQKDFIMLFSIPFILDKCFELQDITRDEFFQHLGKMFGLKIGKRPASNKSASIKENTYHKLMVELSNMIKEYKINLEKGNTKKLSKDHIELILDIEALF